MSLTPEQQKLREGKVTASFAPYLMAGKKDRILSEWQRLVGHHALVEPDWEEMWNLHYGQMIEPIALDWHQKKTGRALSQRGRVVTHPVLPHVCCTLDAYRTEDNTVIDCKAWSSWQKIDYICSFLTPQIIVQRACVRAHAGALLIVHGGTEPKEYPIEWDVEYEALVWERISAFWRCVLNLTPPVDMPAKTAPIMATRVVLMEGKNEWASYAKDWLDNRKAAKTFVTASEAIKEMVPEDAARCEGHGIRVTRSKAGSLTIGEQK